MSFQTGSKHRCLIAKAKKKTAHHSYLASTTTFIITILTKLRTEKFLRKGSGRNMGVTNGK
jgi:hypothetical protein